MERASVNELLAIHNGLMEETGYDDRFTITAGQAREVYTFLKKRFGTDLGEQAKIYGAIVLGLEIGIARGYLAAVNGK